jgi:CDP-glucose 4,6-dehydratase
MEDLEVTAPRTVSMFSDAYRGARVLVTGHTGFKGAWLSEWLLALGADVTGLALEPNTTPSLFIQLGMATRLRHFIADIRSADDVRRIVLQTRPDYLFHLAAQPLVRRSYREPAYTWQTNVIGTINVMESLRELDHPCAAVIVTSDKCYENRGSATGYREDDPLGGHDPYSASKGAAELAVTSWRRSYFGDAHPVRIATARAGNVIGGGDWAEDRLVPDCVRALERGDAIGIRNPNSKRPWQHVLEPNSGYLALAAAMMIDDPDRRLCGAFNIGPGPDANQPVQALVDRVLAAWPGTWIDASSCRAPHEASILQLDNRKADIAFGWRPTWTFDEAVRATVGWYRDCHDQVPAFDARGRTHNDILAFEQRAAAHNAWWAKPSQSPHSDAFHA